MPEMVAVDFLVVPTIRFRMLFVFIVLSHVRSQVVHFNVTTHPTGFPSGLSLRVEDGPTTEFSDKA